MSNKQPHAIAVALVLEEFREFTIRTTTQRTLDGSHHNPIWQKVAEMLEAFGLNDLSTDNRRRLFWECGQCGERWGTDRSCCYACVSGVDEHVAGLFGADRDPDAHYRAWRRGTKSYRPGPNHTSWYCVACNLKLVHQHEDHTCGDLADRYDPAKDEARLRHEGDPHGLLRPTARECKCLVSIDYENGRCTECGGIVEKGDTIVAPCVCADDLAVVDGVCGKCKGERFSKACARLGGQCGCKRPWCHMSQQNVGVELAGAALIGGTAAAQAAWLEENLCQDEGCPHHGTPHVCLEAERTCRECGCTDADCSGCIAATGSPCRWVEADLCSACLPGVLGPSGNGTEDIKNMLTHYGDPHTAEAVAAKRLKDPKTAEGGPLVPIVDACRRMIFAPGIERKTVTLCLCDHPRRCARVEAFSPEGDEDPR